MSKARHIKSAKDKKISRKEWEERLTETISQATMETLENIAFMEVERVGNDTRNGLSKNSHWVNLLVHDPVQGEFRMIMPIPLISEIYETILGLTDTEVTDDSICDTMGEILNTIGGIMMKKLLSEQQVFQLGLPELGYGECPSPTPPAMEWTFQTGEHVFCIVASGESLLHMRRKEDWENN